MSIQNTRGVPLAKKPLVEKLDVLSAHSPSHTHTMSNPNIPQKSPIVKKMPAGTYWWCACGLSKDQPLCDGSHKGSGIAPKKVELTEEQTVAWCGCKHSADGAFCDGSHKGL